MRASPIAKLGCCMRRERKSRALRALMGGCRRQAGLFDNRIGIVPDLKKAVRLAPEPIREFEAVGHRTDSTSRRSLI
jgi:hypothetical protein